MGKFKNQVLFFLVMGGKTLRFPKRKKFVASGNVVGEEKKEEVSPEEHEKRLQALRDAGLIK